MLKREDSSIKTPLLTVTMKHYETALLSAGENGWGYGEGPKTEEEFLSRLKGLTDVLLENPYMFGFCYTQLYDIEQEKNGIYTYERKPKYDVADIKKANEQIAEIEKKSK